MRLKDKVALVTGGNSGIGRGIARRAAAEGARVAIVGRDHAKGADTVAELRKAGHEIEFFAADLGDEAAARGAVAAAAERFGRLDVVVNNAGAGARRSGVKAADGPAARLEKMMKANLESAYYVAAYAMAHLKRAGGGAIVNISSRASDMVMTSFVAYGTAKAALNMMTRNIAAELAPKVRVNAISVGGVATDALAVVLTNDEIREQFERNTPMGRAGTVEDIAACALYLASPASAWVTGKVFQVDGGTEAPAITIPVDKL
jgi:7-alpha-hydroxysteroid dehydrogenase